jgi:hypothetical protein
MAAVLQGRFVFLATPRTGSHSVVRALVDHCGAKDLRPPHLLLEELSVTGDEFIFTTIRTPYEIVVIDWLKVAGPWSHKGPIEARISLVEYIRRWDELHPRKGEREIFAHLDVADEVMRHESLESDFARVMAALGWENVPLPHLNPTTGRHPWYEYVDPEALKAIHEKFGKEFERACYPFWPSGSVS